MMRKILKRLRHCTWEKQDKIKYSFFPVSSPCRQSLSGQDTTLLSQFSTLFPPGVAGGIHPCGASRCRSLCIPAGIMNYIFLFQPSIDYNIFYYLHKKRERERERERERKREREVNPLVQPINYRLSLPLPSRVLRLSSHI